MVRVKNWPLSVLIAGVSWMTSCTDKAIVRDEIPGIYVLSTRDAIDTLAVRSNGTYIHRGYVDGTLVASDSSRWAFPSGSSTAGDGRIEFQDFLMVAARPQRSYTRAWWLAHVERNGHGVVRIIVNRDKALYYSRI